MASFNLNESQARFTRGLSSLTEFAQSDVEIPDAGGMADQIVLSVAIISAKAYEAQTGSFPDDEQMFAELMADTLMKLARKPSLLARVGRKVLQNPKRYSRTLKGSL